MSATTLSPLSKEQEELVLANLPLAKKVAWVTARNGNLPIETDDAISLAHVGLIQAARRFDPSKYASKAAANSTFKHFAWQRMRGAIIDDCRRNSLVRRTDAERGERAIMVSLDDVWADSGEPKITLGSTSGDIDYILDFCDAMTVLTARERKVVVALGEGHTGREIGLELGITESRVSQIASAARTKLKERMAA